MVDEDPGRRPRHAVLEVFGMTLEVSNPRLAELLTMDARDALTADVRDLLRQDHRSVAEAIPDVLVALPTPRSEMDAQSRRAFRAHIDSLGSELGFTVELDGTWSSPVGIDVVTRVADRPFTAAAAAHYVREVATMTERLPESTAVLYIVESQDSAESFKVAIRQRRMHHLMRTVALDRLEEIAAMHASGRLDHREVLILLAPIANIDIAEMMTMLREGSRRGGQSDRS